MKTVAAAIIEREGRILLTRRARGQTLGGWWEFPGGKQAPGETLTACLERELREELAVTVRAGAVFAENIHHYDQGAVRLVALFAELVAGEIVLSVHDRFAWVEKARLADYDLSPADIPIARKLAADAGG
jgi:8-oxo-dGTP diphosphatase